MRYFPSVRIGAAGGLIGGWCVGISDELPLKLSHPY